MACIVSTANKPLVGTLITIGDVTRNIGIGSLSNEGGNGNENVTK